MVYCSTTAIKRMLDIVIRVDLMANGSFIIWEPRICLSRTAPSQRTESDPSAAGCETLKAATGKAGITCPRGLKNWPWEYSRMPSVWLGILKYFSLYFLFVFPGFSPAWKAQATRWIWTHPCPGEWAGFSEPIGSCGVVRLPWLIHGVVLAQRRRAGDCAPYHKYVVVGFVNSFICGQAESGVGAALCHRSTWPGEGWRGWLGSGCRLAIEERGLFVPQKSKCPAGVATCRAWGKKVV